MRWWLVSVFVACGSSHDTRSDIAKSGATELEYQLSAPISPDALKRALDAAHLPVYQARLSATGSLIVQIPYARIDATAESAAVSAVQARFGTAIAKATWSGNHLHLLGSTELPEPVVRDTLAKAGVEVIGVESTSYPEDGKTSVTVTIAGPEAAYERAIEARFPVKSPPVKVEWIGPTGHHD